MLINKLYIFIFLVQFCVGKNNCGYDSCAKIQPSALNVHIVCYSHKEVGWVKTIDQYYDRSVRKIFNSVFEALKQNSNRKFVQVETAFLHKWWSEQSFKTKSAFKGLVNNGQFEIVGGGWTINDEATCHYQSIIDQFTLGLRFINETFGECGRPKTGWQNDVSGHSQEMANIFKQLGFDGIFLGKLDFRDDNKRSSSKQTDFLWKYDQGSANTSLFSSIVDNPLWYPRGFCFDKTCSDYIDEMNKETKTQQFVNYVTKLSTKHSTNNVLVTFGSHFHFEDAKHNYYLLDKLIRTINANKQLKINAFYSTPSCYLKSVNQVAIRKNLTLSVKTGDFFPYASARHQYWSGFYTSKPTLKKLVREGNNLLQVSKQLCAFVPAPVFQDLFDLQKTMAVMQHHNAITGTEKKYVAQDYVFHLANAMEKSVKLDGVRVLKLIKNTKEKLKIQFNSCPLSNISVCPYTESKEFLIALYNPLAKYVNYHVRVPVKYTIFTIKTNNDTNVLYQVSPSIDHFKKFKFTLDYDLTFFANGIPPLGIKIYYVTALNSKNYFKPDVTLNKNVLGSKDNSIILDSMGYLEEIKMKNISLKVQQKLMYYNSFEHKSGHYIFQPVSQANDFHQISSYEVYKGILFDEVRQVYSDWARQIIRVYKHGNDIEFDWIVGPLDDNVEVISRFYTEIDSNDIFFVDSNGRGSIKRRRNYRDSYFYDADEGVAGNYYPIVSKIFIKDRFKKFSVLTDRSQGGTSLLKGQVELMLHRRMIFDEGMGVGEALHLDDVDEGAIARGQHYITLTPTNDKSDEIRVIEQTLQPWIFISDLSKMKKANYSFLQQKLNFKYAGIKNTLPDNIHLLTLEPWNDSILIRLENIVMENVDPILVDLNNTFTAFDILNLRETTMGANQLLKEKVHFKWKYEETVAQLNKTAHIKDDLRKLKVYLKAGQIRTFIANVKFLKN